tara:strand:- start:5219 stop:6583 length:1365 start_codon:yes stop_codon:yes gene_type:complete
MYISELEHVTIPKIDNKGGSVVILNTGSVIDPEAQAMLAALHSRHPGGIKAHLEQLGKRGAKKFMEETYVGYGHKSVGDNGSITIFIEGVSMLVAKAIQDWPLYNGQEVSTRYVDWGEQIFINPMSDAGSRNVLDNMRSFYVEGLPALCANLEERFPRKKNGDALYVRKYQKAIRARAFDILRGFLPAGASTNLAWHTNIRQATDKLEWLRHHPLAEVRATASTIHIALREAFPSSFVNEKVYVKSETCRRNYMLHDYLYHNPSTTTFQMRRTTVDILAIPRNLLEDRPIKTEFPEKLRHYGTMTFEFPLDFGSYRDLQRHRSAIQEMPLLTTEIGFEDWYLSELPEDLREKAEKLLFSLEKRLGSWGLTREMQQYYIPMGYLCSNCITADLPSLVYIAELRATRFVHPTLRKVAGMFADTMLDHFGEYGLVLHLDNEPDRFDVRRGEHDIVLG